MAKKSATIVSASGEPLPFLRGILVQSLADAGLSFEQAYGIAQGVREALPASGSMEKAELRALVARVVERQMGAEARQAYERGQDREQELLVRTPNRLAPFSVGILSRYLEGCAVGQAQALAGARTIYEMLRRRGLREIDTPTLRRAAYETLKRDCCAAAADRFLSRCQLEASGLSLIVLLGGPSGAGKSTVAADLAYLLDIPHVQSSDMIREIVRSYLAPHLVPTLGYSSYQAWRGLPGTEETDEDGVDAALVIAGFLSQFGVVRPALEATIDRAVAECQDLIVDGVHVLPSKLALKETRKQALVVPLVLAVATRERLAAQLRRRSREQPRRRAASNERRHLDAIWDLQAFMLDQAEKHDIPVILNWTGEEATSRVLEVVMASIVARFPPDPGALD
jgi:2-phosphoglycerate kinase